MLKSVHSLWVYPCVLNLFHRLYRMILALFVLGISTRKIAQALLPVLGEPVSATTVSRVAKSLDTAGAAFHRLPITRAYRFLIFYGVVLVALGITPEGRKELIDFAIAPGESQEAWEVFLTDLYQRGLIKEAVELIVTDGGKGLLAAIPTVYPTIPIQLCWAHTSRNVLNYVRKADWEAVKPDLHAIQYASGIGKAQRPMGAFSRKWEHTYPQAVSCLRSDEEELLSFSQIKEPSWRLQIRTPNAIERRFRELRLRTRPMGVFSDRTSMERILYAVFSYENLRQGLATPFLAVTQNY